MSLSPKWFLIPVYVNMSDLPLVRHGVRQELVRIGGTIGIHGGAHGWEHILRENRGQVSKSR